MTHARNVEATEPVQGAHSGEGAPAPSGPGRDPGIRRLSWLARLSARRREILTYLVPILVAVAAIQTWFAPGKVIASGDLWPPVSPGTAYRSHWNHLAAGEGGPAFTIINAAYYEPLRAALWLGMGEDLFQRLWLTTLIGLAVGGTVFFVRALTTNPFVIGIGAVLAVFNPYRLVAAHEPVSLLTLGLAGVLGGLLLRAAIRRGVGARPLTFAVASLGLSFLFINPAHVVLVGIWLVASLILAAVMGGRASLRAGCTYLAKAAPLVLLVNIWWIVPLGMTILNPTFDRQFAAAGIEEWAWTHQRASLSNVVALDSSWATAFPEYAPFGERLTQPPFDVLRYFFPVLAVLGVVLSRGRQRTVALTIAVFAVGFIWIAKGLHAPFGGVNRWLYDNLPGFWLFREPFKVLILLGLALGVLAGFGVVRLASSSLRSAPVGATLAGILLVGAFVYVHPLITGAVIPGERPILPSAHVRVPDQWRDAARYLRDQPAEGKVLVLPRPRFYAVPTTWGYYGTPFIRYAVDRAFLEELPGGYYTSATSVSRLLESIEWQLRRGRAEAIETKLRALGIHYILLRRDIDLDFPGLRSANPAVLARGLLKIPGLELVRSNDLLELYKLAGAPSEVYSATPVTYDGPAGFVPEALGVAPEIAFVAAEDRERVAQVASQRVSLDARRVWRVVVKQAPSGVLVRLETVSRRLPHIVQTLRFAPTQGAFVLGGGRRSWVVDRDSVSWHTVGQVAGKDVNSIEMWQPRVPGLNAAAAAGRARPPKTAYQKLSPSEFRVRVSDARGPFVLTLAETRAAGWRIEAPGRDVDDLRHVTVNGYANGWLVPWRGTYQLKIVYEPEQNATLARSAGIVLVPLAILVWLGSLLVPARWRSNGARLWNAVRKRSRLRGGLGLAGRRR